MVGVAGVDRVCILSLLKMDYELLGQIECTSNTLHLCILTTGQTQLVSVQPRKHFAFMVNAL